MPLRTVAHAGLASIALLVPITGLLVLTDYPFADASPEEVVQYFDDHRRAFMAAIVIELPSIGFLLVFVTGIAGHQRESVSRLTLTAGAATALLIGLEITTLAAAAFQPTTTAVEALWPLGHFGFGIFLHVTTGIFVASATVGLVGEHGLLVHSSWRTAITALGVVAAVGSATIPFGYLGRNVDLVAGVAEHAISTAPYALWVVATCLAILAHPDAESGKAR